MTGDRSYTVVHVLDGAAAEWLEREAERLSTFPDVLLMAYARESIDKRLIDEAQERTFTGDGR